jgi:hypothetical protein
LKYDRVQPAISGTQGLPDGVTFRIVEGDRVGMDVIGEKTNLSPLPGIEPRFIGCQTLNLVAIPTEQSQNFVEYIINKYIDANKHLFPLTQILLNGKGKKQTYF